MIYATQQPSSQSAFTTKNGKPYNVSFLIFDNKETFKKRQDEIWKNTNGKQNLINQKKRLFGHWFKWIGYDFVVFKGGYAERTGDYLDDKMMHDREDPEFRITGGEKIEWDEKSAEKEVTWYGNH